MTGCLITRSTHALSRATGSDDARIPTSGTIGASLPEWQSQYGETSHMTDMWKLGLSLMTAAAYSTIFLSTMAPSWSYSAYIASKEHIPMHRPHPAQDPRSMEAFFPETEMAFCPHALTHLPHPTHLEASRRGFPWLCISIFPRREAHPIARFFIAPPNPVTS